MVARRRRDGGVVALLPKKLHLPVDNRKNLCYNMRNTVEVHCAISTADGKGLTARCQQERGRCRRQITVASVLVWVNKITPTVAFAESYRIKEIYAYFLNFDSRAIGYFLFY